MGEYRLDRFTVLLVEDNGFISQTLETLLRQLKIARLTTAKNGEEAIEWLKLQKKNHNPGPDIIISDLLMPPINGLLLLRWVRTAKEFSNRFVPFVMLSGAADRDCVTASRDLGTMEFSPNHFQSILYFYIWRRSLNSHDLSLRHKNILAQIYVELSALVHPMVRNVAVKVRTT